MLRELEEQRVDATFRCSIYLYCGVRLQHLAVAFCCVALLSALLLASLRRGLAVLRVTAATVCSACLLRVCVSLAFVYLCLRPRPRLSVRQRKRSEVQCRVERCIGPAALIGPSIEAFAQARCAARFVGCCRLLTTGC